MSVERHEHPDTHLLRDIRDLLRQLVRCRCHSRSAKLLFVNSKGEEFMDVTVHLTDAPLRAFLAEFDGPAGTGNQVPGIGPTSYTSSDPTVATVDPVSGNLKYLKAGSTTIVGLNAGNQLTASGVLSVISGIAQSAVLQFLAQLAPAAAAK
jgi:hypothetical protein